MSFFGLFGTRKKTLKKTLHEVIEAGANPAEITRCIKDGADPNARDKLGRTPLDIIVLTKDESPLNYACALALIENGASVNVADDKGITPLHNAALAVNRSLMSLFIAKGANVNAETDKGNTLIHLVTRTRTLEAEKWISLLARAGADLTKENKQGESPLYLAAETGNINAVDALLLFDEVRNHPKAGLHLAAGNGYALVVAIDKECREARYFKIDRVDIDRVDNYLSFPEVKAVIRNWGKPFDVIRNQDTLERLLKDETIKHILLGTEPKPQPVTLAFDAKKATKEFPIAEGPPAKNLRSRRKGCI
jgi:ankyrin repeat protein